DLGPLALDHTVHGGHVAQIGLVKTRTWVDLVALASREIVDDGDFMTAARRQGVNRMGADKAGSAADQYSHSNSPSVRLDRPAPNRVVAKLERFHQGRVVKIAPIENDRRLEHCADALEVGMAEL